MVKAKKLIEGGSAILLLIVLGVMMTGLVPSFADTTEKLTLSTSSEWSTEAGADTLNIEYATDSQHDIALTGLVRWNGTGTHGLWESGDYNVSGDRVAVETTYHSENDSEILLRVLDSDSDETLYEENLTATGTDSYETTTHRFDLSSERNVTVEYEMDNADAEVYDTSVTDEEDTMSSLVGNAVIGLLVLSGLVGAYLKF